jgi:hypothetical protein
MGLQWNGRIPVRAGDSMVRPAALRAIAFLVLLSCAAVAVADGWIPIAQRLSGEQMHATGLDTLTADQLALLDRLLREETARVVDVARREAASAAVAERKAIDPASFVGLSDEPIRSRLVGSVGHWEPGYEFRLDNGQVWKVLKGTMRLRKPLVAPEVLVVPGIAGRWFLQVDEDLPKARVYRSD